MDERRKDRGPEVLRPRVEEPLVEEVARRVQAQAGLSPPRWFLLARLSERAQACGQELLAYLRARVQAGEGDEELLRAIESMLVGETRFFRHAAQLQELQGQLPGLLLRARDGQRPVRVWCAGCASGEEAWTLAMMLGAAREQLLPGRADSGPVPRSPADSGPVPRSPADSGPVPEVLGTDLSKAALVTARHGLYPAAAAARLPQELAQRFLLPTPVHGGTVRVVQELRDGGLVNVRFVQHNLLDPVYPGHFDLILCRNVLIYFDEPARRQVIARLRDCLLPGGRLLLGPAEGDEHLPHAPVGRETPMAGSPALPWPDPPAPPAPARSTAPAAGDPAVLRLRGSYGDGSRLKAELRPHLHTGRPLHVELDGADYLDDGDARVLRRAAAALPLCILCTRASVHRWLQRHGLSRLCQQKELR